MPDVSLRPEYIKAFIYVGIAIGMISDHLNKLTPGKSYILTSHANEVPISIVNNATKKTIINELITYSSNRCVLICIQTSVVSVNKFKNINNIGNRNISTNINAKVLLKESILLDKNFYFHLAISKVFPALSFSSPSLARFIESILKGYPHDFTVSDILMFCLIGYS